MSPSVALAASPAARVRDGGPRDLFPGRSALQRALLSRDPSLLPGRREEGWRWTDLRGRLRTLPAMSPVGVAPASAGPFGSIEATREILFVNGRRVDEAGPIHVHEDEVVRLRFVSTAEGRGHAAQIDITVEPGAALTLLESYEGVVGDYVSSVDVDVLVEEGGSVERVVIQADGLRAISVSSAEVRVRAGARFAQTVFTTGAGLQRHETRVDHPGCGAQVRLDAAYVLAGEAHGDLTSIVSHEGVNGTTSQVVKGVVGDRARGVFQGRIVVARGADGTDARLRHDSLLLSDEAEIASKPELEIYADDVSCAHGNTVGSLDEDQLFYIRSRGVGLSEARTLLMRGFLGAVVERVAHDGARSIVTDWVAARLTGLIR